MTKVLFENYKYNFVIISLTKKIGIILKEIKDYFDLVVIEILIQVCLKGSVKAEPFLFINYNALKK